MAPNVRGSFLEGALGGAWRRRWHIAGFAAAVACGAFVASRVLLGVALERAEATGQALAGAVANTGVDRRPSTVHPERRPTTIDPERAPTTATATADDERPIVGEHDRGASKAPRGFLIRERAVLAAARGGRPSGAPVAAEGDMPAGLRLSGAPAPFRDGDVLVSVGGTPARSEDAIITAVLGAVKSGAHTITGEIARRDASGVAERVPFAVEVPARFWRAKTKAKGKAPPQ